MSEVMGTFGNMTLHAGPDAWVRCGTYTNGAAAEPVGRVAAA